MNIISENLLTYISRVNMSGFVNQTYLAFNIQIFCIAKFYNVEKNVLVQNLFNNMSYVTYLCVLAQLCLFCYYLHIIINQLMYYTLLIY